MGPKLKIIPLGGLGEIGKNMTAIEFGTDIIVIDCGMGFPDESMYGIDMVLPDFSYLKTNAEKIRGLILTHGHEDHIGAVPYFLNELNIPIYTLPLTAALIELKLEEQDLLYNTQIFTKKAGSVFRLGCFTVEFIHVNHSIPDAVALAITTPLGTIVHTGDFKIDITPISGGMIDLVRFGELGNEGVLALMSDSTNVEKSGYSDSEHKVGKSFETLFAGCNKRIIITTFASNVHRLQQIIDVAVKYGRKVGISGRSMENVLRVASVLGYMNIPEGVMMPVEDLNKLPKNKVVIISTGSQGESMSALYRMAFSEHKQIQIDSNDRVIISASAIPGNETMITRVIDELFHKGAEVIYDKHTDLHVSGHACQEEQKMILGLVKPKYFIPVHGEYRMLKKHASLAVTMGVNPKNIVIAENGTVIEISKKNLNCDATVPAGAIMIDGSKVSDVGEVVMRDRKKLAEDGMIVIVMPFSSDSKCMISEPEIITRGFVYVKEAEELIDSLKQVVFESADACESQNISDYSVIKGKVKNNISGYLFKEMKRSPMVLPVIVEV